MLSGDLDRLTGMGTLQFVDDGGGTKFSTEKNKQLITTLLTMKRALISRGRASIIDISGWSGGAGRSGQIGRDKSSFEARFKRNLFAIVPGQPVPRDKRCAISPHRAVIIMIAIIAFVHSKRAKITIRAAHYRRLNRRLASAANLFFFRNLYHAPRWRHWVHGKHERTLRR